MYVSYSRRSACTGFTTVAHCALLVDVVIVYLVVVVNTLVVVVVMYLDVVIPLVTVVVVSLVIVVITLIFVCVVILVCVFLYSFVANKCIL